MQETWPVIQISTTDARSPICAERSTFLVGERAKRARHSQVCSIENRIYIIIIYIMVRPKIFLITRKEGGA